MTVIAALSTALAADPPVIQMPQPKLGILTQEEFPLVAKGVRLLYDGYYTEAVKAFDRLRELLPRSPAGELGRVLPPAVRLRENPNDEQTHEDLEKGLAAVERKAQALLEEDPQDSRGLFYVGAIHFLRSQAYRHRQAYWSAVQELRAARTYLEQVVNRKPDAWEAYVGLGGYNYFMDALPVYGKFLTWVLFLPGGSRERGLEQLHWAQNHSLLLGPLAQNILMVAYCTYENNPERAQGLAQSLHRRFPNNPWFHLNLGYLSLAMLGRAREGVRTFQEVLDRVRSGHPNYEPEIADRARIGLLFAYRQLKEGEALRKAAEQLLKQPPVHPKYALPLIRLLLGEQLARDGRREEARRLLTQVLEVGDWGHIDWRIRMLGFGKGEDFRRRAIIDLDGFQTQTGQTPDTG